MQLFSSIKEKLSEYVDVRLKLYQVQVEDRAIQMISSLSLLALILCSSALALLFVLIFLAKLINYFVFYEFIGYGIVALICIFMSVLLVRKKSQQRILGKIQQRIRDNIKSKSDDSKDNGSI
jgi:hypothetical protein